MKPLTLTGRELLDLGLPQSPAMALAIEAARRHYTVKEKSEALADLKDVLANPEAYRKNARWGALAMQLCKESEAKEYKLAEPAHYTCYGADFIERGAIDQMNTAVRLPVAVGGALMPDAHQGYGLPIGGVLATNNAVIPYGVGVDIGCRMCLSVYDIPEWEFERQRRQFASELLQHTRFGAGAAYDSRSRATHPVLDHEAFRNLPAARAMRDKAFAQLGTSGGGNHFVEWGILEMFSEDKELELPAGRYLGLLTHSGSRGLGAHLANHYTKVAKARSRLPKEAINLSYLSLDSAEGQEYWEAMNLAGLYASACHQVIHERLTAAIGGHLLARVENHHNFAWRETWNGQEVIVHRKGATPAGAGVLGIIPGSMTAPGFLVRGKGEETAINSASHGAGRQMSRTMAEKTFNRNQLQSILKDHGVTLIGGGLDEAPGAYKDINQVMAAQKDLVTVVAQFQPKIVRMADDGSRED